MAKCPICGGTGKVVHPMMSMNGDEYTGEWEQHECEACNGTGVVEPLTNEEYMQTCSSDELANTIFRLIVHGTVIRPDREYIKRWLKEKHHD